MGVHCVNTKSKDFINLSLKLNIGSENLEDILHKYLYDNDTDEYPSDDYIRAALEGTRTEMSQSQADLWERDYSLPKRFKILLELNEARRIAQQFFRKEAISEYIDANGNYVLKVAPPSFEKEYLEILAKAPRDSEGRLLAPNGKPSNLTERQYALVRSKAFKKWFGDWENNPENASKVVDENGEPLVVYHGTSRRLNNNSFNSEFIFASDNDIIGAGYGFQRKGFSIGIDYALSSFAGEDIESFRQHIDYLIKALEDEIEMGENAPFYQEGDLDNNKNLLKELQKAKQEIKNRDIFKEFEFTIFNLFQNVKNPLTVDAKGKYWHSIEFEGTTRNTNEIAKIAKDRGYDGLIIKNVIDKGAEASKNGEFAEVANDYIAFEPNQIKSATDNTGAFSTTNDNIYLEHEYNLENPKKDTRLEELSRKNEVTINDLVLLISLSEYNDIINVLKELSTGKEKLLKDIKVSVINPLDYYSKANEIRSKFNGRRAYYDADTNTIVIDASANFSNGDASSVILHEIMHHITVDRILSNPSLKEEFITLIKEYRKHYPNEYIGAIDNHYIEEFIADIWSNRNTIEKLKKTIYKGPKHTTSLWNKILLFFKNKLFKGAVKDSMFELASNLLIDTINTNIKEYSKDTFYELLKLTPTLNFSTRELMLNTMVLDADAFIGEVSLSPYTKVGDKFVLKNNTEVEKAVNFISKRGVPKKRRESLLSEDSIKYLTENRDNTSYYNIGYLSGYPSIQATTNRELFDEGYTPKTIMFLRDLGRLDEDIIKTQLEQFKDTSTFLVDASDTKAIKFFNKNGYNYKVYQVGQQLSLTLPQKEIQLSTTGYKKGDPLKNPNIDYVFTENAEAYVVSNKVALDKIPDFPNQGKTKLGVSDMNGTNQAGIRNTQYGTIIVDGKQVENPKAYDPAYNNPNAYGIVVKKYQQNANGRFVAKEGQFQDTDEDFALFVELNEDMFKRLSKSSNKKIIFPTQMGLGKAALPMRFTKWLQAKLLKEFGILSTIEKNARADYDGYGLRLNSIELKQLQQTLSLTLLQLLSTLPMVTKIISGGLTGVDTIGLLVARELGIETGGTAPKNFLREQGIDEEDISSYGLTEITDELQAEYTNKTGKRDPYTGRTELNVRNSDGTVYFYTDEDKSGMIATQRAANEFNKPFLVNPTAELLRQWIKDNNIQTLNVAGNRGSKLAEDNKVAETLREALRERPEQKQQKERDPFEERLREINRKLDTLQESSLMTNTEIREIAELVVYWISDHITELLENPELAVKIYGDSVKNLDTQTASRIEIVNAIGLDNLKEMCRLKFSPKNAGYKKISTIRKASLIVSNWDAIILLASDVFTEVEKFSITETVVADKVVSLINENLNNNLDNFDIDEQNDDESVLEAHGNLLEHWQTKVNTIDVMDSMSLLMHRTIIQCYLLKEVGRDENNKPIYDKVRSEFGINLRVKPREATSSLLRWCLGCLNIKDVIVKLKEKEASNPWVSLIITKLEDESGNESDFQSLFFGVFVKPFILYSIVKINENGEYVSLIVNKNPALKEAVKGITTLYKIGEHPMFMSSGAVNKQTFRQFSLAMQELANLDLEKDKDTIAKNLGYMYNALGFSVTDDLVKLVLNEDTYKMLKTLFGYIHKSLFDHLNMENPKEYEPFKFKGNGSFLGTLNKVLLPITDTLEDTAVSSFYDNGNMYQSYVIPSYMTKLMSKFHLEGKVFDDFITSEYGKYGWFKDASSRGIERGWKLPILKELVNNPLARQIFEHKVLLTFNKHQYMKKMDDVECTLAILSEYWSETNRSGKGNVRVPAWFRVPMLSNKPSAEYIKFYSERGVNYLETITENIYKIFLLEMSRIQTVMMRNYDKSDPEFIKNFDKNGKKFNFVDFMNEYLTGDSKNSELGKIIQAKINGELITPNQELALENLAKEAINKAMTKKAETIVNNFERKGIFEGAKRIEGIDKNNIREELINFVWNDTYMSMNILLLTITDIAYYKDAEDLLKRLALIHAPGIRANRYATDYNGNPVSDGKMRTFYLKDFDSFISNIIENVDIVFSRRIKEAKEQGKSEQEIKGLEALKDSLTRKPKTLGDKDKGGLFYLINVADALGYSSPSSYRKKAFLFGKWSKEAEDIYLKLITGNYTYSDLKTAFLPLKPFVYTLIEKSSNVNLDEAPMLNLKVPILNKNSEYLLIMADAMLLGENTGKPNLLRAIYSVMEQSSIEEKEITLNNGKKQIIRTPRTNGIDTVLFESTVKSGLRGAIDINQFLYADNGEKQAKEYIESLIGKNGAYNETYVDEIPVEDYCLQLEVPGHFRNHELTHGSLIRAITPSDLESVDAQGNPVTYNVEGRKLTAELFKDEYQQTIADNIKESIELLTEELKLGPEATQLDKNKALEKILRREILSSPRYGVDLLLACTLNENGQFRIPKGDPIQSKRIELLLNSIIKNRVNKQEIAGGPVVQVSNFGTSKELNIRFKSKDGGLLMTREEFSKSPLAKKTTSTSQVDKFNARYKGLSNTMTYEDYIKEYQAGIAYFEVFAPIYLNDVFEKFLNPDGSIDMKAIEELNPDLLKMIGYRIPTEDKYSCAPLKIVGFLPREAGDAIMLPNDITLLTGSDFKQYWSH